MRDRISIAVTAFGLLPGAVGVSKDQAWHQSYTAQSARHSILRKFRTASRSWCLRIEGFSTSQGGMISVRGSTFSDVLSLPYFEVDDLFGIGTAALVSVKGLV